MTAIRGAFLRLLCFTFFSGLQFYVPLQLVYFERITGSYTLATSVVAVSLFSAVLWEVPTGIFSDVVGRRRTVVLGAACAALAVICYAIAATYWLLMVGSIIQGAARALYSGNNIAYLYDLLAEYDTTSSYTDYAGKISATMAFAELVSALLSGLLAALSFTALLWASAAAQILCLLLSTRLREVARRGSNANLFHHLREAAVAFHLNPRLRLLSISTIASNGIGLTSYQLQAAVFALLWPLWAIGWARALGSALASVGFFFSGRIIKRFGVLEVAFTNSIIGWLANLVPALFPTSLTPLVISFSSVLHGPATVATGMLLQKEFSDEHRATMGSLNSLASSLLYGALLLGIGVTSDKIGPIRSLVVAELCYVVAILANWRLLRLVKGSP